MNLQKIGRLICLTLLLMAGDFSASAEDFTNALHAFLQQRIDLEGRDDGIVVGLVDPQGTSVVSCGELDNSTHQEVNGDTIFEIGSVTKTFTGLLLADMVERGQMKLDDAVAKYLPESVKVPTRDGHEITLLDLATHTSGLPGLPANLEPKFADNPDADYTIQKLDNFVSGCQLTRDPGTKYEYSTVGMALLGQVIALKAGTNYESLLIDRICRPLKLDSTRITLTPELKPRFATGHNDYGYVVEGSDWGALAPGAALRSTANDLLKYLSAEMGLRRSPLGVVMKKTQAVYFHADFDADSGLNTNICLAWNITVELDGTRIIEHGGLTHGFMADICFDAERQRGVVVLCNHRDFPLYKLGRLLLASEWQSNRRPQKGKINDEVYKSYVGQYQQSQKDGTRDLPIIGVRREGARLCIRSKRSTLWPVDVLIPELVVELVPQSADHFFERLSGLPVSFSRDVQGTVTGMTVQYEGKTASYQKISADPPKQTDDWIAQPKPEIAVPVGINLLDAMVGQYQFAPSAAFPAGEKLMIWRAGDQLVGQASGENAIEGAFGIYPTSETNFFIKINGSQLTFIKNSTGKIMSVVDHSYQTRFPDCEGKKLPETP